MPEGIDVVFGQPAPREAIEHTALRWVHLNSAGYTALDRDDVREAMRNRGAILTTSSSVYAEPVAQHILAMMLSLSRQLPKAIESQLSTPTWNFHELRRASRLLNGQRVLILGFGAIARRLIELLRPFDMDIAAIRRNPSSEDPVRTYKDDDAKHLMNWADHVVNILPATPETAKFLNGEFLGKMRPEAILYNVGRGTTVDQAALINALEAGRIAAAYLDVTDPEPLPPDHPLWTTRNCYITPHSAGGHDLEAQRLANHFLSNFERFRTGAEVLNRVI